ncbi:hypothetical protein LCGC14_2046440, partial [marine sediment metagenome]
AAGPNLISNSTFDENIDGWYRFTAGIKRDTNVYKGSSGASMYFPPNDTNRKIYWTKKIKVTPGHFYTFRAYFRSTNVPSAPKLNIYSYNAAGERMRYQQEWFSVSKSDTWQETAMEYRAMDNVSDVLLYIGDSGHTDAELWVDDVYFGEGRVTLEQASSSKAPFTGNRVKIDSKGNFEVNQNGAFKPFFPFGITNTSLVTSDWAQKFSNQGFNYSLGSNSSTLTNLKAAKSQYNPNGMMMMASTLYQTGYDPESIKNAVNNLKSSSASDAILSWYYEPTDGNKKLSTYPQIKGAYNAIKTADTESPVFWSLGQIGFARALGDTADVTGIFRYSNYLKDGKKQIQVNELGSGFKIASNLQGVTKPNSIATISVTDDQGAPKPTPAQLRALTYHAIWGEAKGVMFWWEKQANGSKIDTTDLWSVFPVLRSEIQTILPIVRQGTPGFSVNVQTQEDNKMVDVLAKEYNGDPYIIVVNTEDTRVNATFNFVGLPFAPTEAIEIFSKGDISFEGNNISTTLEAYGTSVYQISSIPVPDTVPPSVFIASPQGNETVSATINVLALATDNVLVDRLEFYVDDLLVSTDIFAPYEYLLDTTTYTDGAHALKVIAFDSSGLKSETSIIVNINNKPDPEPPADEPVADPPPTEKDKPKPDKPAPGKGKDKIKPRTYTKGNSIKINSRNKVSKARLYWLVKDNSKKAFVKLVVQKRVRSKIR